MSETTEKSKRSPLKRRPLRNPGESLQEEMARVLEDQIMPEFSMALILVLLAGWEWWRWFAKVPPQPVLFTVVAIAVAAYTVRRFFILRRRYRALRLGLEGEKAIGQFLETLRSQGCRIFHDILGEGFNVDHVVIGPHGVFAIETKTYSKPVRGEAVVKYDGEKVLFNGMEPDRNPVTQARAVRDWVGDLLFRTTGRKWPVRGVIIPAGWYVKSAAEAKGSDIWVLNEKALPSFMAQEPVVLKSEDIALAAASLENYVIGESGR